MRKLILLLTELTPPTGILDGPQTLSLPISPFQHSKQEHLILYIVLSGFNILLNLSSVAGDSLNNELMNACCLKLSFYSAVWRKKNPWSLEKLKAEEGSSH